MKKILVLWLIYSCFYGSTFAIEIDIPDVHMWNIDRQLESMDDRLERMTDKLDSSIDSMEEDMERTTDMIEENTKNARFSTTVTSLQQTKDGLLYTAPTRRYFYNSSMFSFKEPTVFWTKNFITGKISAKQSVFSWIFENGKTWYKAPTVTLIKDGNNVEYTGPVTKVRLVDGDLYYRSSVYTLKITKDGKIHYTAPTRSRTIDGKNWKYTAPTKYYSN